MAADLGISKIYASGKMVGMSTNMSKRVFKLMTESMTSDAHRNSLVFKENEIKVHIYVFGVICFHSPHLSQSTFSSSFIIIAVL